MSTAAAGFTRSRSGITPWRIIIRTLWPCEHEHFLRHLLRLDGPTRRERFGRGVSDDWIARYAAETDGLRGAVLGCWIDGTLRGVAELRRYGSGPSRTGETALSIEPAFQNHGLGSLLARRIVLIARNRGFATLCMFIAASNWRMRSIAQKLGARMALAGSQIEAELTLGSGTAATPADESQCFGGSLEPSLPKAAMPSATWMR
jgi:GNAT superfamily N-acetyltransferase